MKPGFTTRKRRSQSVQPNNASDASIGNVRGLPLQKGQKVQMPDFQKRIKARFGNRMLRPQDVEWLDKAM